jgi:hypothetical protein
MIDILGLKWGLWTRRVLENERHYPIILFRFDIIMALIHHRHRAEAMASFSVSFFVMASRLDKISPRARMSMLAMWPFVILPTFGEDKSTSQAD